MTKLNITRKLVESFIFKAQHRRDMGSEADLILLGLSLKDKQLQPVGARPDGTLIWGHRRVAAAKLVGMKELDTVMTEENVTEEQVRNLQMQENLHTKNLSQFEMAQAIYNEVQITGCDQKTIAEKWKIDTATVCRLVSLFTKGIPAVREAVEAGKLPVTDASEIVKAPEAEQQELLAFRLNGSIANRAELQRAVRKQRANGGQKKTAPDRLTVQVPGRGNIAFVVTKLDSMDDVIDVLAQVTKSARWAQKEKLGIGSWIAAMADQAKSEGNGHE